MYVTTGRVGK